MENYFLITLKRFSPTFNIDIDLHRGFCIWRSAVCFWDGLIISPGHANRCPSLCFHSLDGLPLTKWKNRWHALMDLVDPKTPYGLPTDRKWRIVQYFENFSLKFLSLVDVNRGMKGSKREKVRTEINSGFYGGEKFKTFYQYTCKEIWVPSWIAEEIKLGLRLVEFWKSSGWEKFTLNCFQFVSNYRENKLCKIVKKQIYRKKIVPIAIFFNDYEYIFQWIVLNSNFI